MATKIQRNNEKRNNDNHNKDKDDDNDDDHDHYHDNDNDNDKRKNKDKVFEQWKSLIENRSSPSWHIYREKRHCLKMAK